MDDISEVDIIGSKIEDLTRIFLDGKVHKVRDVRMVQAEIRRLEARRSRLLRDPSRLRRMLLRLRFRRSRR